MGGVGYMWYCSLFFHLVLHYRYLNTPRVLFLKIITIQTPPPPRAYQRVWLFLLEIFGPRSCALGRPFLTARPRTFQKWWHGKSRPCLSIKIFKKYARWHQEYFYCSKLQYALVCVLASFIEMTQSRTVEVI